MAGVGSRLADRKGRRCASRRSTTFTATSRRSKRCSKRFAAPTSIGWWSAATCFPAQCRAKRSISCSPSTCPRHTDYDLEVAAERIRATAYPQAQEFAERNVLRPPSEEEMLNVFYRSELRT